MLLVALFLLVAAALIGPLGRSDAEERRSDLAAQARSGRFDL
jgi:hypothetical protein